MEIEGLNTELNGMMIRGQLSGKKIAELIYLREFVDRISTTRYVPGKEVQALKEKFGVEPAIQSWGDYFQTELASQYFHLNDQEFEKIVSTVRFDLISSIRIFEGKSNEFKNTVHENGMIVYGKARSEWSELEEQSAHLYILLQYYRDMKLSQDNLETRDEEWFDLFIKESGIQRAM